MNIKALKTVSFAEAAEVWNRGYEGYYSPVQFSLDEFVARFGRSGLSVEHSYVAYKDSQAVGILVSGVKDIAGMRMAWNGGTAVVPEARKRGIGKALMETALLHYHRAGVRMATLEAFTVNQPAISLYEHMGYRVVDELVFLKRTGSIKDTFLPIISNEVDVLVKVGPPEMVQNLSFYRLNAPWTSHYPNLFSGQSAISYDSHGNPTGYALFRKTFDEQGNVKSILLLQCVHAESVSQPEGVVRALLRTVWSPIQADCTRMTFNFPSENKLVTRILKLEGFTPAQTTKNVPLTQVFMIKEMVG